MHTNVHPRTSGIHFKVELLLLLPAALLAADEEGEARRLGAERDLLGPHHVGARAAPRDRRGGRAAAAEPGVRPAEAPVSAGGVVDVSDGHAEGGEAVAEEGLAVYLALYGV